jgi:GntR family transcriptional regulator
LRAKIGYVKKNLHGQLNILYWVMAVEIARGGTALFRRIADALADAIARGDHPVGGQLPTEFKLMRMFGASRFTIREALAELRSRGLIASRRGSGTVVLRKDAREPVFGESYRSVDDFLAGVIEAPLEPLEITDVIADADLSCRLRCEEGRQFVLLRGVRRRRGQPEEPPIALVHAYVNATYGAIRPYLAALSESIAGTAERALGVRVQRIVQELEAVLLQPSEAETLRASEAGPAMLVRRWYYLDNEEPLLISRSVYPQGRLVYRTELRRGDLPTDRRQEQPNVRSQRE